MLHFGDHNVNAGVRLFRSQQDYDELQRETEEAAVGGDIAEILRVFNKHFDNTTYNLKSLFRDEQRRIAEDTIADVEASGLWPGKVVTEVAPAGPFWEAEPEHQDYLERYPDGYTCHFVRPGWKLPRRAQEAAH